MNLARTIVVLIVAFAVALLPAIGGAVRVANAMEAAAAPVAAMAPADMPCEHAVHAQADRAGAVQPCHQDRHGTDDCGSIAACAAKCFNFAGLTACGVTYAPAGVVPVVMSAPVAYVSHTDPPPSPPPRV